LLAFIGKVSFFVALAKTDLLPGFLLRLLKGLLLVLDHLLKSFFVVFKLRDLPRLGPTPSISGRLNPLCGAVSLRLELCLHVLRVFEKTSGKFHFKIELALVVLELFVNGLIRITVILVFLKRLVAV